MAETGIPRCILRKRRLLWWTWEARAHSWMELREKQWTEAIPYGIIVHQLWVCRYCGTSAWDSFEPSNR
jgi:hypothetical protein